jgi:UDP-2-acetamido-2,6-beta-L-arabino-hexul-4-ose reductase
MNILVTGADGFIGKNFCQRLAELEGVNIIKFVRTSSLREIESALDNLNFVIHLAGVNRPTDDREFTAVNHNLTQDLCDLLASTNKKIPIIFSSSAQASLDNPYGKSKQEAEKVVMQYASDTGSTVYVYRLPGVFGKWCKPNYNSVVATFCYNIANGLPISVRDPNHKLMLVYIDDVVNAFIEKIYSPVANECKYCAVSPEYEITLGELADLLSQFKNSRDSLISENVGTGLVRALYSTFMTYYSPEQFSYKLPCYSDSRGRFVEMLKTKNSGQFSYFTAPPGETRGEHYHHSKTEKFLVILGKAKFGFRNLLTDELVEIEVNGDEPRVVETIPGWVHNITNIGDKDIVVMLWANEIFDRQRPDTIARKVGN